MKLIPKNFELYRGYADSANPDKIKELNKRFKVIGADKSKLPVDTYIEFMNNLNHIYVLREATLFIREAGIWSYKKDTDVPEKVNDDINDAIRYALQPVLLELRTSSSAAWQVNFI